VEYHFVGKKSIGRGVFHCGEAVSKGRSFFTAVEMLLQRAFSCTLFRCMQPSDVCILCKLAVAMNKFSSPLILVKSVKTLFFARVVVYDFVALAYEIGSFSRCGVKNSIQSDPYSNLPRYVSFYSLKFYIIGTF
uniref:Uncharacterized protein n=1 Tax=Parascaris univalens TaxID=6257 RepID=A0A914ZWL5_PARUN